MRYKKFLENHSNSKMIEVLNQIKDVFLTIEDEFGISLKYNYYKSPDTQIQSPRLNDWFKYIIFNEYGNMVGTFKTKFFAPNGYFIVEREVSDLFQNENFKLKIEECTKRAKLTADIELSNSDESDSTHVCFIIK